MKEVLYRGYCEIHMGLLLDAFSKAVKEDGYERVSYSLWSTLKKEGYLYLHAYRSESDASYDFIFSHQKESVQGGCSFNSKDKSLGAFCVERYLQFILKSNPIYREDPYEVTVNHSVSPYKDAIETMKKIADEAGILKTSIVEMTDEAYKYVSKSYNDKNKEGERKMNAFNFDFGPVKSTVHMSPFGLAIRNKDGNYVSYHDGGIVNVDPFNIEGLSKYIYKMPTATNAIKPGDLIVHSGNIVFVDSVAPGFTSLNVIDICDGTKKEIIPTKSMFGFDFVTKIVCLLGDFPTTANPDNPFGNILPFLLMGNSDVDIDPVVAMALCGGNFNEMNPMLMYAMIGKGNNDLLPMMFLSQQGIFNKK